MNPLDDLTHAFIKFPGIGKRQAKRFAYFVVQSPDHYFNQLITALQTTRKTIKQDPVSFEYFYAPSGESRSPINRDSGRDDTLLMIIEKDVDIESIEKSRAYHGRYFVLGGLAPLIDTEALATLRITPLLALIESKAQTGTLREVIFAFAANPEGDRTSEMLRGYLEPIQTKYPFTISQLGRGFSTGTEVEYSDPETLASALENRK